VLVSYALRFDGSKVAYRSASGEYRSVRAVAVRGPRVGRRASRLSVAEFGVHRSSDVP